MTVVTSGPKKEGTDASASGRYADVRKKAYCAPVPGR